MAIQSEDMNLERPHAPLFQQYALSKFGYNSLSAPMRPCLISQLWKKGGPVLVQFKFIGLVDLVHYGVTSIVEEISPTNDVK